MKLLITGGAGFIGSNAAEYFASKNHPVTVYDNLYREGSEINLKRILKKYKKRIKFINGDIRDAKAMQRAVNKSDAILHLAGQTAVVTSLVVPLEDFELNATGTIIILEAIRKSKHRPLLLFSSTNKVYGSLDEAKVVERKMKYEFKNIKGVSENFKLDFHTPYGCSKGVGDQYVIDYARSFGLKTLVFRQSCIYGTYQHGFEGQGWISWFCKRILQRKKINIFGDGKQVRDVLYISDLLYLFDIALRKQKYHTGEVFNVGGGVKNSVSILETLGLIEKLSGIKPKIEFKPWRESDQKVYISDISKVSKSYNWKPKVSPKEGIKIVIRSD